MQKLTEVEEAKALLMEAAKAWPIWQWLSEKRRVREIADRGTAALDAMEKRVKAGWSQELSDAYAELDIPHDTDDDPFAAAEQQFVHYQSNPEIPEHIRAAARRVKEADDTAYRARMTAEETFDRAERRLSVSMARQGAEQACEAYELRYAAIQEAEAAQSLTRSQDA
jgi:hypothetical protein